MDGMIRRPHDPPPFVPGTNIRFEWPDAGDPCVKMVRERVQEGAPGLFVLRVPGTPLKCLAECYYPDQMKQGSWSMLDPMRRADWQDGRLVCITTVPVRGSMKVGGGKGSVYAFPSVTDAMVTEIRKNNRNARSELRRASTAIGRKRALEDEEEARFEKASSDFADFYTDAYLETEKFALGKPRVSMYTPRSD